MKTLPKLAEAVVAETWTDSEKAIGLNDNLAVSDVEGETFRCLNYEFAGLPDTIGSVGILVTVRAKKDPKTGTLETANLHVDLSWDGGSSWTTPVKIVSDLTTALGSYDLGSDSDDWGRTWSRSDFNDGSFVVRIKSNGTKTGDAEWQVAWVAVQVTFTKQSTTIATYFESLNIGEAGSINSFTMQAMAELPLDTGASSGGGGGGGQGKDLGEQELS